MAREIVGVIVGYVVMVLVVFTTFSAAYLLMGADAAFRPGTYQVSGLWLAVSFALGLVAAVAGGYVCASVARTKRAPLVLAAVVVFLGLLAAIPALTAPAETPVRTGDVPNMEAMRQARTPAWVALVNPLVGAVGVVVGARLRRGASV
jgi:hypothetical protein